MSRAQEYFRYLPDFRLVICKTCRHAVWPKEATAHLKGSRHDLSPFEARVVLEELKNWPDLYYSSAELDLPRRLDVAIPCLPIYTDGLRCQLDDGKCSGYVSRSVDSMKVH
jgi:hypothetical protein